MQLVKRTDTNPPMPELLAPPLQRIPERLPITLQQYRALPRELGWRYEDWDGHLHVSRRAFAIPMSPTLPPVPPSCDVPLRTWRPEDREALLELLRTEEGWQIDYLVRNPRSSLRRTFRRKDVQVNRCCFSSLAESARAP